MAEEKVDMEYTSLHGHIRNTPSDYISISNYPLLFLQLPWKNHLCQKASPSTWAPAPMPLTYARTSFQEFSSLSPALTFSFSWTIRINIHMVLFLLS